MITGLTTECLTQAERSQIERKELARGAWAEGRTADALLILRSILSEEMTPRVAAECYVTEAAYLWILQDFGGSRKALDVALLVIDSATFRVQGSFYLHRGLLHKQDGDIDAAITDYTGAAICWERSGDYDLAGTTHLNLANILIDKGELVSARTQIEIAFQVFLNHAPVYIPQAYDSLAQLELAEGRLEPALRAIDEAIRIGGENEDWREEFFQTKSRIEIKLLELLDVKILEDVEKIRFVLVREALKKTGGNLSQAAELIGFTYKGIDYIVQKNPELIKFRTPIKRRLKSIIKK